MPKPGGSRRRTVTLRHVASSLNGVIRAADASTPVDIQIEGVR
jgi:hypothetical protein